ncbi:MAG: hypothetical protein WKF35_00540 [Ferruginibacter sp.]
MSPVISFIIFFSLLITINSCSAQKINKAGVLNYYYFIPDRPITENVILFKDSAVILEMKAVKSFEVNDTTLYSGYDVYKYTYLDLTTMRCQDYNNLSDTAKPYTNYVLKHNDIITWNFYKSEKIETKSNIIFQKDTIIDNLMYKRIKTIKRFEEEGLEYIYYLECNGKQNIFHVDTTIERKTKCKIIRSDLVDSNGVIKFSFRYQIIRTKLREDEERVFTRWKINASETSLPLLKLSDVEKIRIDSLPIPIKVKY